MTGDPPLPALADQPGPVARLGPLAAIPEEEIWLAAQVSARTRRAARKCAAGFDPAHGYSAHPICATAITTILENGAALEGVQKAAGHRRPSTTKLYDRRRYNPAKAACFFAAY